MELLSATQSPKANLFGSAKRYYKPTKREIGETDSDPFKSEYNIVEYKGPESACKSVCGGRTEDDTRSPISLKRSAAYAHVIESERTVFVSPVRTFRPVDIDCELRARLQVNYYICFQYLFFST